MPSRLQVRQINDVTVVRFTQSGSSLDSLSDDADVVCAVNGRQALDYLEQGEPPAATSAFRHRTGLFLGFT